MRCVIFSDSHIPFANTSFLRFLDMARSSKDDLVIGNGDVYDLLRRSFGRIMAGEPGRSQHRALLSLAREKKVVLVMGNHDATLSRHQDELPNIEVVSSIDIDGFHLEHGHRFDLALRWLPWRLLIRLLPALWPTPYRIKATQPEKYRWLVGAIHGRALAELASGQYRGLLMGHTHFGLTARLEGRRAFGDSGDFVDSGSYLELRDGLLRLREVA